MLAPSISEYQYTKFEMPIFTRSKDMIGGRKIKK